MAKGSVFERAICKVLSVWWTGDPNQDFVFWRSATSGAMSTVRARKGKKTQGHCGDIMAVDHVGAPLTSLITIELKRGYHANATIQDLIDRTERHKQSGVEGFIQQARQAARRAGTKYWMAIFRRDQREAIVIMPDLLQHTIRNSLDCGVLLPCFSGSYVVRQSGKTKRRSICITTLESFMKAVSPKFIRKQADFYAQARQA